MISATSDDTNERGDRQSQTMTIPPRTNANVTGSSSSSQVAPSRWT